MICPRCRVKHLIDGCCIGCGYGFSAARKRRKARRQPEPVRDCDHREWTALPQAYVGGEYRDRAKCAGCGLEREGSAA